MAKGPRCLGNPAWAPRRNAAPAGKENFMPWREAHLGSRNAFAGGRRRPLKDFAKRSRTAETQSFYGYLRAIFTGRSSGRFQGFIMIRAAIALSVALLVVACGGSSKEDVSAAMEEYETIQVGFFDEVEAAMEAGDDAAAAAKAYVDKSEAKLKELGETLGLVTADAAESIEAKQQALMTTIQERATALGEKLGQPDHMESAEGVMNEMARMSNITMMAAANRATGGRAGEMAEEASSQAIDTAADTIVDSVDAEMLSMVPEESREDTLDDLVSALTAQNASEAKIKDTKDRLREKLGW